MHPTHIFVTGAPGRLYPVHPSHASAPGGSLLFCREGKVYRIPYNTETRRGIDDGDIIPCTRAGAVGLKTHRDAGAKAPHEMQLEVDETGALVPESVEAVHTPHLAETVAKFDTTDVGAAPAASATPTKGA